MNPEDTFIASLRQHEGIIYKVSSIYAREPEDRYDLYQEIILQLWKAWGSFKKQSKLSTWMYRIAMNTAITYIRKQKRRGKSVKIGQEVLERAEAENPALEERMNLLYRHIESLNKLDKALILLFLEEKNYEEIAEITGLSKSNVGTRLSRIKQRLKSQIRKKV
ncbi:MAG: sigma-70 family RNA polymerase sigma factor [Bacteroidota bacterium]